MEKPAHIPELITLHQQALFAPTQEWAEDAKATQRWLRDRLALLGARGVVAHEAAGRGRGSQ
jgi:hypothetical protein